MLLSTALRKLLSNLRHSLDTPHPPKYQKDLGYEICLGLPAALQFEKVRRPVYVLEQYSHLNRQSKHAAALCS